MDFSMLDTSTSSAIFLCPVHSDRRADRGPLRGLRDRLQPGEHLGAIEAEEPRLIGTNLVDADVVEAGLHIFHDRLHVTLRIRPANDLLRDGVFGDELGHVLEVCGRRQLPRKRALHGYGRPDSMRSPPCGLLVLGPADGQASVPGLAIATGFVEDLYEIALCPRRDNPFASSSAH